jgi:hypothetical protein
MRSFSSSINCSPIAFRLTQSVSMEGDYHRRAILSRPMPSHTSQRLCSGSSLHMTGLHSVRQRLRSCWSHNHRTALADVSGLFERKRQLKDTPIIMMPANNLKPYRKPTG